MAGLIPYLERNMAEAGWDLRPVHPDRPVFSSCAEGGRRPGAALPAEAGQLRAGGDVDDGVWRVRDDVVAGGRGQANSRQFYAA